MARAERRLEEVRRPSGERPERTEEPAAAEAAGAYVCPMHPDVRQGRPGTCPKCGMRLEPERAGEARGGEEHAPDHDAMLRDMRAPWLWTNATVMMLGLWLVSSPFTFGYRSAAMMWSDVASGVLLVLFGLWLLIAPWVLMGASAPARWSDMAAGVAIVALTVPRGIVRDRYGAWDTWVV